MNLILFVIALFFTNAYASQTFTLYGSSATPGQVIDERTKIIVAPNKSLYVLVHGFDPMSVGAGAWLDDARLAIHQKIKDAYVLKVEWVSEKLGGNLIPTYEADAKGTAAVGQRLGLLIKKIIPNPKNNYVHCIGHSLGAHICAASSNQVGTKLSRISALDPAGPLFMNREDLSGLQNRLDKTDAFFVDVYHTNNGRGQVFNAKSLWKDIFSNDLGFTGRLGHFDFLFADGSRQPACPRPDVLCCSHSMATQYFIESIKTPDCFTASNGMKIGFHMNPTGEYTGKDELTVRVKDKKPYCS